MKDFLPKKILFWLGLLCLLILLVIGYSIFTKNVAQQVLAPVEQPEVFQAAPFASNFGFNIHSLSNESEEYITCLLNWLSQNCGTTFVRLWGYQSTLGIDGFNNLEKVLNAAPSNIKFIVALEDFPFGPAASNPSTWFSQASNPSSSYYQHAEAMLNKYGSSPQIAVWELMNEPHCKGDHGQCFENFKTFTQTFSQLISSKTSAYVSPGLMGGHLSWEEYQTISNFPHITANSCHYNSNTNNPSTCLEAISHKGNVDFFYVGEAGYQGAADCSGGGCTNSNCTNCCDASTLTQRVNQVKNDASKLAGADAFLIWQFSPPGNSNLICDNFSVFPGDPICSSSEEFTCSPTPIEPEKTQTLTSDSSGVRSAWIHDGIDEEHSTQVVASPIPSSPPDSTSALSNSGSVAADSSKARKPEGEVNFSEVNFPNFHPISSRFSHALKALLTAEKGQGLSLAGSTKLLFRTSVTPKEDNDWNESARARYDDEGIEGNRAALEDTTVPAALWGTMVSAAKGLLLTQPAAQVGTDLKFLRSFKFSLPEAIRPGPEESYSMGPGPTVPVEDTDNLDNVRKKFRMNSLFAYFLKTITDIIENILHITHEYAWEVRVTPNAKLSYGVGAALDSIKLAGSFLPAEWMEEFASNSESKSIMVAAEDKGVVAGVALSPEESGGHELIVGDQDETRRYNCASLCSSYTKEAVEADLDWVGPGKMCPSCDPDDYAYQGPPRTPCKNPDGTPDWERDPQECVPAYCTWVEAYNACQYGVWCNPDNNALPGGGDYNVGSCGGEPQIEPGCEFGKDPICESCLGLPHALVVGEHMNWCGGNPERDCLADCSRCKWINPTNPELDEYDDSRFNGCYYAGPTCVQTNPADQSPGNICSYGCSPDCCQFCD